MPATPARYRRKGGGWWKGPAIALSVLAVAAVATFICWRYLPGAMQVAPNLTVAQNDTTPLDVKHSPEVDNTPKEDPPVKPKDAANPKDKDGAPKDAGVKPKDSPAASKDKDPNPKDKDLQPTDPPPPPKGQQIFPRRALVISVHNYLYANPVHGGRPVAGARNIPNLLEALNKGLHISMNQMAHLSDAAVKGQARSPMKPVIQKTLSDFLEASRAQDRVMVFFIGHAVALNDQAYLVPIEGELDNADSLIPLKWVYDEMAKCKARQKVLVLDVNRLNPSHGLERPNGGPMDPKTDAALKAPPEGVQVWSACVAGQQSYELDDAPMGLFLEELSVGLAPDRTRKGLEGKIQKPEDPLPLEALCDLVNSYMKEDLTPYKLAQQSRLAGAEPKDGAAYVRAESQAPPIVLASAGPRGSPKQIQAVLDEVGVPAIKASREDNSIHFDVLPPFPPETMADYPADGAVNDLRTAILKAREMIWAVNTAKEPAALSDGVMKIRKELKVNLSVLKDGYRKPPDEMKFKAQVLNDEREIADLLGAAGDALDALKAAGEKPDAVNPALKAHEAETKRWQVNYDFILARLEAQIAYLMEYQSMLGQMRKQLPDLAPGQNGWKLASLEKLKGDSLGKNMEKASRKLLEAIIKNNPGTPWEVLAKREKLTALGLEWQGAKNE